MEITEFFAQSTESFVKNHSVILFTGKSYSPLFFDRALVFLQKKLGQPLKKINLDQEFTAIQIALHTSFLGQTQIYCFGDLSLLSSKKKKTDWIKFIQSYQGPHTIIGFLCDEDNLPLSSSQSSLLQVSIAESYNSDQIKKLSFLYDSLKPEVAAHFFAKLYRINSQYSLDQICLLQDYSGLLGKSMDLFFDDWVEKLVVSDISLFYLSQLFFEKKAEEFFVKWSDVRPYYSDQFWTTFFSEQLFKAYFYVQWQGRVPVDQKQITFGLPFSFLKQDWKLYTLFELQASHQKMYEIDLALKSGGSSYRLDAFFALFFSGDFS
ncbi:MAG: hypothetical protein WC747_00810 [Candidatus Babeliales bacterium]|jgi:hypothetical protein